jgi:methylated-DNA-protein-cysteine methyltransferase related protein
MLGPPFPRWQARNSAGETLPGLGLRVACRPLRPLSSVRVAIDRERAILRAVSSTPVGFVRTYGDVSPGAPRVAGAVLHACDDPEVPWHRIVRADGSLAKGTRQRRLLEAEGVPFRGGRVDMRVARLPEL